MSHCLVDIDFIKFTNGIVFNYKLNLCECYYSATNETKLLLWWHKMLELCLRQIDFGAEQRRVVKVLLSLIPRLVLHGEDKSSSGLFGAIGLGRKSVLSFRYLSIFIYSLKVSSDELQGFEL